MFAVAACLSASHVTKYTCPLLPYSLEIGLDVCGAGGPRGRQADPNNIDLHEGLAALCVDSGNPEEAAALYRRCLGLHAAAAEGGGRIRGFSSSDPSAAGDLSSKEATEAAAAAAARTDRWSVALFKCNASLCQWDDWNGEALALRTAVRRRGRRRGRTRGGGFGGRWSSVEDDGDLVHRLLLGYEDDEDDFERLVPRDKQQRQDNNGGDSDNGGVNGGADAGASRPALHPFDSLSAPLSIGDCLAVAQQQTRGVLAEARGGNRGPRGRDEEKILHVEGVGGLQDQSLRQFHTGFSSPSSSLSLRDGRGRTRLGYVSGDLMGTHPLTHLMQARAGGRTQRRGKQQVEW